MIISAPKHSRKRKRRVARGESSGWGCSAGRGTKGQKSRTGGGAYAGHEGGQLPVYRKLAKARGFGSFANPPRHHAALTLGVLSRAFPADATVTLTELKAKKLIPSATRRVKVVVRGPLGHALHLKGIFASQGATQAIAAAGGSILKPE